MDPQNSAAPQAGVPRPLSAEEIRTRLGEVALFHGLGERDLAEILRVSESLRVDAGEHVFEEGERGDHLFIIVHGSVELRRRSGNVPRRLTVLEAGQAFGEMALLHQTPRAASARALEDTYMLSVSRAAFSEILGGDGLALRLLRNISRALWATSVRLAEEQARAATADDGRESISEFNRSLRARILPRVTPRVTGYDIATSTLAPRRGAGSTAWDWFVLGDGRPAFCVTKSRQGDVLAAQRLAAVRLLLRAAAKESSGSLGPLLTGVDQGLRAGWVEGVSGPVAVGVLALADGAAEWAHAGPVTGMLSRATGLVEDLGLGTPALGEDVEHAYRSRRIVLARGDRVLMLTGLHANAERAAAAARPNGRASDAGEALFEVLRAIRPVAVEGEDPADVSAALVARAGAGASPPPLG